MWRTHPLSIAFLIAVLPAIAPTTSYAADDVKKIVADLDTQYQLAVTRRRAGATSLPLPNAP